MRMLYIGLFFAALVLPAKAINAAEGPASPTLNVDTLVRPIARGERIGSADFTPAALPTAQVRGALQAEDIGDVEAVRPLAAGHVVRAADIQPIQLVRRGDPVSIEIRKGALTIAANGRALASGSAGAAVRVFSTTTGRTIDAIVSGPGKVIVALP